jgi:hypothetical protein
MFTIKLKGTLEKVKATKKGEFEGIKYDDSLTLTLTNVLEVEDDELGLVEKEVNVLVKVPVKDLRAANAAALKAKSEKKEIEIPVNGYNLKSGLIQYKASSEFLG